MWKGRVDGTDESVLRIHQVVQEKSIDDVQYNCDSDLQAYGFVGFCSDEGVRRNQGRVGASTSPDLIRQSIAPLPYKIKDKEKYYLYDFGNVVIPDNDLELGQNALARIVKKMCKKNIIPIVLGGGHETAYGTYSGAFEYYQSIGKTLGILNFDAHFDLRNTDDDRHTSGTPFLNCWEKSQSVNAEFKYFCYGVSLSANTQKLFQTADELNVQYCTDIDVAINFQKTVQQVLEFSKGVDFLYITIDLDTFSSGNAPGVSAVNPAGTSIFAVEHIMQVLKNEKIHIGLLDIVELNPKYDIDNITSKLAGRLVHSFIRTHKL